MVYEDFLSKLSNPARRALEYEGVNSFEKLASISKKELLKIHGIGPKSLPAIKRCLDSNEMKLME